jgi:large conductance mechanosensitive channel
MKGVVKMGLIGEFKKFAMRGNVVDMAVGIIIGGAFGKIVSSLVSDIITPPIGMLLGNEDFTKYSIVLKKASETAGKTIPAVTWNYGTFISTIIDFLIVALAMFIVIKMMNAAKKKEEAAPPPPPPAPSAEEKLLSEIRDILKSEKA